MFLHMAGERLCKHVLSLWEEPGQGRGGRLGAQHPSGFSGRSIRQRLSRKEVVQVRAAAPGETEPEEEKLQTSEGETPDQALGMA